MHKFIVRPLTHTFFMCKRSRNKVAHRENDFPYYCIFWSSGRGTTGGRDRKTVVVMLFADDFVGISNSSETYRIDVVHKYCNR